MGVRAGWGEAETSPAMAHPLGTGFAPRWWHRAIWEPTPMGTEMGLSPKPARPAAPYGTGMPSAGSTSLGQGTEPTVGPLCSPCIRLAHPGRALCQPRRGPRLTWCPSSDGNFTHTAPPCDGTHVPAQAGGTTHPWAAPEAPRRRTRLQQPWGSAPGSAAASAQAKQPLIKGREGAERGPELHLTVLSISATVGTCQGHGDHPGTADPGEKLTGSCSGAVCPQELG